MGELYSFSVVVVVVFNLKKISICTCYLNGYIENILFINQKKSSIKNNWREGGEEFLS